jgi:hypothetical protein
MAKGEHDKVDERLIIQGSRRSKPSERAKGKAYPKTVTAGSPSSAKGQFRLVDEITHHIDNNIEKNSVLPTNNEQRRKYLLPRQENTNKIVNTI